MVDKAVDEILDRAYSIADRIVKPWKCATSILGIVCASLLLYILLVPTSASVDLSAEDIQASLLETNIETQSK